MAATNQTCTDCGAPVTEAFQFCPSCGIQLPSLATAVQPGVNAAAEPVPTAPPATEGWRAERRLVSVMFVDLHGFTMLSEELDPEDVRDIQSRYFEVARSAVARFGGTLEKFIGDAVMAVWGSPVAHENDAERAVRAALEIVSGVGGMAVVIPRGGHLAARAAVTTGEAAVSLDIVGEGMVTGDMVNTASRLQELAQLGSVLVDDATRRAVGDAVRFDDAGERSLKGKAAPVSAWLARQTAIPETSDSVAGHRGPFVGRAPELAALRQLAQSVADDRVTTLASVTGVAGIGKSRLVRELERSMRDGPALRWHRGRPPRWGEGTAFAPLADIVRHLLGLSSADPDEVVRRTVAEELKRLIPDPVEREWVAPRVEALLGAQQSVESEREELFAAWRRFIEAESEVSPVAIVFEDLQWADTDTFDFIDYLTTWSHRHPILVVTVGRPELLERRPTWGAGVPHFRSMHLDRLSDGQIDDLLSALAPNLPAAVAGRVRQRAEGVPLYAVEMARMLTEHHTQQQLGAMYDIPESLHALLAARIDALPERERRVLLMASVLGRRFGQEALAALSGLGRNELGACIAMLIRREFLAVDDEPRSPGRGQLTFVQDLMREVAYSTLSRRDRRLYHEAVIVQLQSANDPFVIEPIAEHLVAAHAAAGSHQAEARAIAERARDALRQAADHAEGQHAPHRALAHLERAIELTDDVATRAELAEAAASAARAAARFDVAEEHLRAAIDLRDSLSDSVASSRDRAHLASVLLQAQRSDTALAELESAWSGYAATGSGDATMVHLAAELARAHMLRGDTDAATSWAMRAIEGADADGTNDSRPFAIDARVSLGTALAQADRPDEGLAELRTAMEDAGVARLSGVEHRARTNLTWLTAGDDPRAAEAVARRGLENAQQVGNREWLLQLLDIAGILGIETGAWDWTLARLGEVIGPELPTVYRIDFAATIAIIRTLRGDDGALVLLDELGDPEPDLDPHALGWHGLARAVSSVVAGDAAAALERTTSVAERTIGFERAEALALRGRVAAWAGRVQDAQEALEALSAEAHWGRANAARLSTLDAAVQTLSGRAGTDPWAEPLATWRELNLPLREALCHADRWLLLGETVALERATALLTSMDAKALLTTIQQPGAFRQGPLGA